ncbi:Hypothetical protein CINCED_3A010569 [Cinara cedri]|nr:Hypothetical protein CINCED_3A010569 [Cinara cedri]
MKVYSLETNSIVERKWFLDLLTCMFGVGSWILVNSLYTQLPLLVQSAPEGWNLPSYISIAIQIGNLGPLLYSLWRKKYGNRFDRPLTIFILMLGIISVFLMAMFYNISGEIFGQPHSIVLCILTFTMALVGCTSSVLFIPSLSNYSDIYLVTYMVGEGISGFVPSLIAIVQGIGTTTCNTVIRNGQTIIDKSITNAYFSSGLFFTIIGMIMCGSTVSYLCLEYSPTCKKEKIQTKSESVEVHNSNITKVNNHLNKLLLAILGVIVFFANGLLPSIQSYSCLPYGYMAYHLATNLSNIANPIACFIAYYTNRTSKHVIFILCSVCLISIIYMLMTAFTSPTSPLYNTNTGAILIVFMWVLFFGCASYVKLSIAAILRNEGNRRLFHYGCITQIGSALGALIGFYLINVAQLLKSYEPCKNV